MRGRGKPFPKGNIPHNATPKRSFVCETCGINFQRSEAYISAVGTPRTCGRICHNRRIAAETKASGRLRGSGNPTWKGGIQTYRRFKKDACERCGSTRFLLVHHKDENRYNNVASNLETLCKRCHQIHHGTALNLPKTPRPVHYWTRVCAHCMNAFSARLGMPKTVYCSRDCYFNHRYPLRRLPAAAK